MMFRSDRLWGPAALSLQVPVDAQTHELFLPVSQTNKNLVDKYTIAKRAQNSAINSRLEEEAITTLFQAYCCWNLQNIFRNGGDHQQPVEDEKFKFFSKLFQNGEDKSEVSDDDVQIIEASQESQNTAKDTKWANVKATPNISDADNWLGAWPPSGALFKIRDWIANSDLSSCELKVSETGNLATRTLAASSSVIDICTPVMSKRSESIDLISDSGSESDSITSKGKTKSNGKRRDVAWKGFLRAIRRYYVKLYRQTFSSKKKPKTNARELHTSVQEFWK